MKKYNKTFIYNDNESDNWISDFLKKFTPDFVPNRYRASFKVKTNISNNFFLPSFTINELLTAISSRRDTAFGLDGIPYAFIKKLSNNSLTIFLNVLNLLWNNNIIPDEWKKDCLVPLLKPNKPRLCPDSYRPIALTSCIGKIFEQLLKQRLEFYVEQNNLLPSNQFGFRRNYSARESICQLQLDIHNALIENRHTIAVFFIYNWCF